MKMVNNRQPHVVAIVLNWNGMNVTYSGKPILELCLTTLLKTEYKNLNVIVADAESSDNSIDFVRADFPEIKILRVKNLGWAYGNNVAIKYAFRAFPDLDYILLLNTDLIFKERNWLLKLVDVASKDEKIGIAGCRLFYPDGLIQHAGTHLTFFGLPDNYKNNRPSGYAWSVIGALFLIKREVIEKIGLFDERYLPFFEEEVDYCERARKEGYKVYYLGTTNIIHLEGKTIYKSDLRLKQSKKGIEFIFTRNNFIFLLRWHKWHLPVNIGFRFVIPLFSNLIVTKLHRTPIKYHFSVVIPALKEALKLYKMHRIPKLKR